MGVVLGFIGSVTRALAHGTGSPVDYYGKLVGVSAAVLTLWGFLARMPAEDVSLGQWIVGGPALFIAVSLGLGVGEEKFLKRRKARSGGSYRPPVRESRAA